MPGAGRPPELRLADFTALVYLPASGCKSREHAQFTLTASIARLDNEGGRDMVEQSAVCGPFRSADDFEPGDAASQYSCNLGVFLGHPELEQGPQYDVEVFTYPGAAAERTMRLFTFARRTASTPPASSSPRFPILDQLGVAQCVSPLALAVAVPLLLPPPTLAAANTTGDHCHEPVPERTYTDDQLVYRL